MFAVKVIEENGVPLLQRYEEPGAALAVRDRAVPSHTVVLELSESVGIKTVMAIVLVA